MLSQSLTSGKGLFYEFPCSSLRNSQNCPADDWERRQPQGSCRKLNSNRSAGSLSTYWAFSAYVSTCPSSLFTSASSRKLSHYGSVTFGFCYQKLLKMPPTTQFVFACINKYSLSSHFQYSKKQFLFNLKSLFLQVIYHVDGNRRENYDDRVLKTTAAWNLNFLRKNII